MDRALMTLDFGVEAESKPRIQVKEVRIRSQELYWAVLGKFFVTIGARRLCVILIKMSFSIYIVH